MTYDTVLSTIGRWPRSLADWRVLVALAALALTSAGGCSDTASTATPTVPPAGVGTAPTVPPAGVGTAPTAPAPTAPAPTAPAPTAPPATTAPPAVDAVVRPTVARDEVVAFEGTSVHVRCAGAGDTTVVLIAGYEGAGDAWAAVEPAIAERTRVCTYDRPGTGASGPPAKVQTFATQAADLHSLLAQIGESGPYVVVGHSFGGAAAVEFADMYVDEVRGLLLVDASPVDWPTAMCAVVDDGSTAAASIRSMCGNWVDPDGNVEMLDVFAAFDQTARVTSLGPLPVTVLTAVERQFFPGTADSERSRLTEAWNRGQQRWAALSTDSRVVSVPDTGHYIQLDQPTLVIDEIDLLLP